MDEAGPQNLSPAQGGANLFGAAIQGVQGIASSWMPTLPNPLQIPKELEGVLGRPQILNIAEGSQERDDSAPNAEPKASDTAKPEATSDLLASAPELRSARPMTTSRKPRRLRL